MKNYISENISYLVKKAKCKQDEFGAMFDLNRGIINQYIVGRNLPKVETIQKICKHFQLTIDDFINLDLSKPTEHKATNDVKAFAESSTNYGDTNKIIEAQQKTIATLERMVEHLEQRINNAS